VFLKVVGKFLRHRLGVFPGVTAPPIFENRVEIVMVEGLFFAIYCGNWPCLISTLAIDCSGAPRGNLYGTGDWKIEFLWKTALRTCLLRCELP
jgi:hypothetical protein